MMPLLWLPFQTEVLAFGRWPLLALAVIILVCILLPRSRVTPRELAREVAIVLFAYFSYSLVRGMVQGRQLEAFDRATDLIKLERSIGIFWEAGLQDQILGIDPALHVANSMYVWGHWPVIVLVAIWLFLLRREHYYVYRNAFLISGAVGLVIYGMLPVAPPRFMSAWGFVDTLSAYHGGASATILVNEYAAMPSLHFGWNLLLAVAIVRHASWLPAKIVGFALPPAMFMSIVLTGNHYILDGLAGGGVALLGLGASVMVRRATDRRGDDRGGADRGGPYQARPALAN